MRWQILVGLTMAAVWGGTAWGQQPPPPPDEAASQLTAEEVLRWRRDMDERMSRIRSLVPELNWRGVRQPWTTAMVRQVAELLGQKDRADKVLKSWIEGRSLMWLHREQPDRQLAVALVRFAHADAARAYQGMAIDLQRRQDELFLAAGGSRQVLDSRSSTVPLADIDEAIRSDKKLVLADDQQPVAVSVMLIRHRELVIELSCYNLTLDPAWAEQVARTLLAAPTHSADSITSAPVPGQ